MMLESEKQGELLETPPGWGPRRVLEEMLLSVGLLFLTPPPSR